MGPQTAVIDLLDTQQGYVLQSWTVRAGVVAQIGRSTTADVSVRNPFVSRSHAYVQCENDRWEIHCLSDGGLLIDGRFTKSAVLEPGLEFRLARKGPLLRFRLEVEQGGPQEERSGGSATMQWDEDSVPLLVLDRTKRDDEVAEIERQSYFGDLKRIAEELRLRRGSAR